MSPLASGDRRLPPPFRPAAAHDSDHVTARLGRSGAYRRLSALRLRTTSDHVTARLGRPAARAAFPPCGCARLRPCHRSPRATGGSRRLSALRLRTTPTMSPLASGDRRLPPPFRPAAAPAL